MPKKDSSWIGKSGLYGTWTFTTQTMTDAGYYKGLAYVVMHLMPDPMQVKSCLIPKDKKHEACIEADNSACSHVGAMDDDHEECVNTETANVEWSDVTAFFQFGFRLRNGIVRKTFHEVHTSDWLGPYNMILAPIERHHGEEGFQNADNNHTNSKSHDKKELYISRYVNTPWTSTELQRPFASSGIFNFDSGVLEEVVGTKAINETIHVQKGWRGTSKGLGEHIEHIYDTTATVGFLREGRKEESSSGLSDVSAAAAAPKPNDDPYSKYSRTCTHGDLLPILPRLEIEKIIHPSTGGKPSKLSHSMKLDYSMLSLPRKGLDDLYKLWPTMKRHLAPQFPLLGPYCYGKDPNRAYAIHFSYDSNAKAGTWKGVKGCVAPWPCWKDDPQPPSSPPTSLIPQDNHSSGSYVLDPKSIEAMIVYGMGFLLVISLFFNCQLANQLKNLKQLQQQRSGICSGNERRGLGGVSDQRLIQNQSAGEGERAPRQRQQLPNRPTPGPRQQERNSTSPSDYFQEAAGDQSNRNSLEEPLLTTSDDDLDRRGTVVGSQDGVEESKEEVE